MENNTTDQDEQTQNTVNISCPGPGPDTVDVDVHPHDRPGVQSRIPDDDPRARHTETGERMPVLLSSDISYDPIEGGTGSYTMLIESECTRCGYDRIRYTHNIMGGIHTEMCNACGAKRHGSRGSFTMPRTERDRAQAIAENGEHLGRVDGAELYSSPAGDDTFGYVIPTDQSSVTQVQFDRSLDIVREALSAGVLSISDVLHAIADSHDGDELSEAFDNLTVSQRLQWAFAALPRWLTVETKTFADDPVAVGSRQQVRRLTRYLFTNE